MEVYEQIRHYDGFVYRIKHQSKELNCPMRLNIYIPDTLHDQIPVVFFLAGLTSTPDNGLEKSYFTREGSRHGIAVVFPDTSPRETSIPGETESWDFGQSAGFYLDATKEPWSQHYRMESYIVDELIPGLANKFDFIDFDKLGITGFSMGGHGALTLFLRHPDVFKSVSAFAPISNPSKAPWGIKAFNGYLGDDKAKWAEHDATDLVKNFKGNPSKILIDVGTSDKFYKEGQLLPENFVEASKWSPFRGLVELRLQKEYNHSYFFVSSFAADHMAHHAKELADSEPDIE